MAADGRRAALVARAEGARKQGVARAPRVVPVALADLDGLAGDALALFVWADVRPLAGVAALVDWRIGGALSRALIAERFLGGRGEHLLLPAPPRLGARRLFVVGLGPLGECSQDALAAACAGALTAMAAAGAEAPWVAAAAAHDDPSVEAAFVRAAGPACRGAVAAMLIERRPLPPPPAPFAP